MSFAARGYGWSLTEISKGCALEKAGVKETGERTSLTFRVVK